MHHCALARFLAASLLACTVVPVPAYEQAGHFYTSFALVRADTQKELALVALCAQLPDMASDLDALAVYRSVALGSPLSWWRWAVNDVVDSYDTRRMVTIQHVLHALTGGDADAVGRVALASIKSLMGDLRSGNADTPDRAKDRAVTLCALGFAFHFYGDSMAHRQLDAPSRMYPTGKGHAFDLNYPDYPMCDAPFEGRRLYDHCQPYQPGSKRRFAAWLEMWDRAAELLDIHKVTSDVEAARSIKRAELIQLSAGATDFNDWGEHAMRKALSGNAEAVSPYTSFILSQKSDRSCENVLLSAPRQLPQGPDGLHALSCASVWSRYAAVVRREMEREPKARADLREGERTDFERKVYLTSPLSNAPVSIR